MVILIIHYLQIIFSINRFIVLSIKLKKIVRNANHNFFPYSNCKFFLPNVQIPKDYQFTMTYNSEKQHILKLLQANHIFLIDYQGCCKLIFCQSTNSAVITSAKWQMNKIPPKDTLKEKTFKGNEVLWPQYIAESFREN